MPNQIYIEGLGITGEVAETVVLIAAQEVQGVAGIGSAAISPLLGVRRGGKQSIRTGIDIAPADDGIAVHIRLQVYYGFKLPEVACAVRSAVAQAIAGQLGVKVSSVDVFIDGVVFPAAQR